MSDNVDAVTVSRYLGNGHVDYQQKDAAGMVGTADGEDDIGGEPVGQSGIDENPPDRWTIRGVTLEARRRATVLAREAGQPIGVWLTNLIANASDNLSDTTGSDIVSALAALAARVGSLECAVFPSDKSDAVNGGMEGESTQKSSLKSATSTAMEAGRDPDDDHRALALTPEMSRRKMVTVEVVKRNRTANGR